MRQLIFKQMQSPGDLLMLTVAVRDLHLRYPDYKIDVISCYPEVFFNNPHLTHLPKDQDIEVIDLDYGKYLHPFRREGMHFSNCFVQMINEILGVRVIQTVPLADIHLTENERNKRLILNRYGIRKPYWLLNAGIKSDILLKQYPPEYYQQVVKILNDEPNFYCDIVQVGHDHHIHPNISGVINLVGKTNNLRDYFSLVYHSEGCIGPVSLQMHLAAAFNKPCVVLAGGREEPSWERYGGHTYLHTIGALDCCETEGCWKSNLGQCPTINDNQRYPLCMTMIKPRLVVYEVMQYQEIKCMYSQEQQIYN